jgi:hypothetical protein
MDTRSTGDLQKIYRYSNNITKSRGRILVMLYHEQNRGTIVDKRRSARMENLRLRLNRLTLGRHDEIMKVYSNVALNRNISPSPRRRRRRTRSSKSKPRPVTASQRKSPSRDRSVSPPSEPETPPRSPSPIIPLKITHVDIGPDKTVIAMIPTSFEPDQMADHHNDDGEDAEEEEEEEDDIIYPEGVIDFRPYKTVARYRKALGKSTNFCEEPLLVADDSVETLILGLEDFAKQHGCDLSFAGEDQHFDKSIYRAAMGLIDLGSVHLLATDSLLTAHFQFEIDLDYNSEITQSKGNVKQFVHDFCDAISNVLSCEKNNVRVFSIDKLTKKSGKSHVNFGLTTSDPKLTEQLADDLQVHICIFVSSMIYYS